MARIPPRKCNRKVFLIKGFSENEQELQIDKQYIEYYKSFFQNIAGGAYEDSEIEIFEDIQADVLKSYFEDKKFEYVVVVLLGHGATQDDYQIFQINENEVIKPGQIEINASKRLIILESCRDVISKIPTIDLSDKAPSYKEGGIIRYPISRQKARELYDKQIKQCDNGKVICFACSKDEKAWGYFFSEHLIQCAFNWHLCWKNYHTTLKITELMCEIAAPVNDIAIKEAKEPQNPQIKGKIDFPFAVSKC